MPNKIKGLFSASFGVFILCWGLGLSAQQPPEPEKPSEETGPRKIVWILNSADVEGVDAGEVARKAPAMIGSIVEESGDNHVVTTRSEELGAHLKKFPRPTPECLQGLAPCANPLAALMQGLGADLLIRGRLKNDGPRWTLDVEMLDPTGTSVLKRTFSAGDGPGTGTRAGLENNLEELAFRAVREIFQATGALEIVSVPPGATVTVDGKDRGQTPLTLELPIGSYDVELTLENHATSKEIAKVAARKTTQYAATLSPQLATVTVDSTPVLGEVFIDNKSMGTAGTPFQLAPGEYEMELRAEGFKTRTQRLIISPEEQKIVSLTLEQKRKELHIPALGEVSTEGILARNYFARVGYRFTTIKTGLSSSEGQLGESFVRSGALTSADAEGRREFGFHGIQLDLGHNWERFGIVALGISIYSSGDRAEGALTPTGGAAIEGVEFDDFTRMELRPAQISLRYPYKNLFPAVQTGFGYQSRTFVADAGDGGRADMEQDGFFWNFSIEVSYFFDTWWYGFASLGIERDLTHDDTGTHTLLSFGVGATFENPFQTLSLTEPPKEAK